MDKLQSHTLTFPLVEGHSRISDALQQVDLYSIDAVVSTDGKEFWLHNKSDLVKAAAQDSSKTLGKFQDHKLPVLSTASIRKLGVDLTSLTDAQVRTYFGNKQVEAIVTSVTSNTAGDRMVVALVNPNGAFKVVGKVWVCPDPNGGERYRSPGICPAHGKVLQPE